MALYPGDALREGVGRPRPWDHLLQGGAVPGSSGPSVVTQPGPGFGLTPAQVAAERHGALYWQAMQESGIQLKTMTTEPAPRGLLFDNVSDAGPVASV